MLIAVDDNVPDARDAFGQFGDVITFSGRSLARDMLLNVNALVVRSVTRVDAALLESTPVRFVGTATIGTDHLDLAYLASRNIVVADAAGCNSRSVAEYVIAALLELRRAGTLDPLRASLGIIGMGRVGTIVAELARAIGMRVVSHDPPRVRIDRSFTSAPRSELLACDVISLHVPLTVGCVDPTWHLVDFALLERMRPDAILINTSRGGVVDSDDLTRALRRGLIATAVLDVWEGEPHIPTELIELCAIATPHIAGYSLDGKARGTGMIAEALARYVGTTAHWSPDALLADSVRSIELDGDLDPLDAAAEAVRAAYDIRSDDRSLRSDELSFDELRRSYPVRREFAAYAIASPQRETLDLCRQLGFRASYVD